jgi:Outer membrane protein beta-barrel domain
MKKAFFILFVSVLCLQLPGLAQKSKVGVTAGFSISNMTDTFRVSSKTGKSLIGYTVGIVVDVPIGKSRFHFQPSLHFMQKGKVLEESDTKKSSIALRYADVDLNFLYNTNGDKVNFFIGAGPSVGLPLPSKKVTKIGAIKSEDNITFGNTGVETYKGIDYGLNFIGGFNLPGGFYTAASYTLGLRNIVSEKNSKNSIKNSCFALRFGYLFNNK